MSSTEAFYLVAAQMEKSDPNYEILLQIWWKALAALEPDKTTFKDFAEKTMDMEVAFDVGGFTYINALREAWKKVKVL